MPKPVAKQVPKAPKGPPSSASKTTGASPNKVGKTAPPPAPGKSFKESQDEYATACMSYTALHSLLIANDIFQSRDEDVTLIVPHRDAFNKVLVTYNAAKKLAESSGTEEAIGKYRVASQGYVNIFSSDQAIRD